MASYTQIYVARLTPRFAPATYRGGWDQTGQITDVVGVGYKAGADIFQAPTATESNASDPFRVGLLRIVSEPLAAQTISGTLDVLFGVLESNAAANFYWAVHAFVTEGETDTVRGTLLNQYAEDTSNEWPTSAAGHALQGPQTLTPVAVQQGDRLVIELGFIARNAVTTNYVGTLYRGSWDSPSAAPDLGLADTNVTTRAGFVTFSTAIEFDEPVAVEGDLLASNEHLYAYDSATGALKRVVYFGAGEEPTGGAQDADGNLWIAFEQNTPAHVVKFNRETLAELDRWNTDPGELAHSIARAQDGGLYVGHAGDAGTSCGDTFGPAVGSSASRAIRKFADGGSLLATYAAAADASGTPAIDLAADQRTIVYTSLGRRIMRYDVVADAQLSDFALLPTETDAMARGIRWLPDGGVLVADFVDIKRYNRYGVLIQRYNTSGGGDWGTVSLTPDGTAFWAANTANEGDTGFPPQIAKFDLNSGSVLVQIDEDIPDTAGNLCSGGINSIGEWRAADHEPAPIIDESLPCCETSCDCPPGGGGGTTGTPSTGSPSSEPIPSSTGPILPPERPIGPVDILSEPYWEVSCEGGGLVPFAADPVDVEMWVS
jgi:hypothetical protein